MSKVISSEMNLQGVIITPLSQIVDNRGTVLHMLRNDVPEFTQFGECYFSEILPGSIKAWKRHKIQTQNLAVPIGRVVFVIYDNRENSSTKGLYQEVVLGRPDAYFRLSIPPNLWYGFACISKNPALVVNCADFTHDPQESERYPFNDNRIPYHWEDLKL